MRIKQLQQRKLLRSRMYFVSEASELDVILHYSRADIEKVNSDAASENQLNAVWSWPLCQGVGPFGHTIDYFLNKISHNNAAFLNQRLNLLFLLAEKYYLGLCYFRDYNHRR